MAEFLTLGGTCSVKTCKLLDFLPFTCAFCRKEFCLDHRTPDSHNCSGLSVLNQTKTPEDVVYYNCSYSNCNNRELIIVTCSLCENIYCMSHRLSEDHECVKLKPSTSNAKSVKPPTSTIILPSVTPKFRGHRSEKTTKQVNLMKLKMKAIGDKGIPQSDRMYFNVILPNTKSRETFKTQPYFFSLEWSVGKIVDFIAEKENIPNYNNVTTAKKLQLISMKDGSALVFNQILSFLRDNGLEDGSELKLE